MIEQKKIATCIECGREFESAGTVISVVREARGLPPIKEDSNGAGLCSLRCVFRRFSKAMRGEQGS
jgi:hypothetical protein